MLRHPDAVRPWQHVLGPLAGYLLLAERLAGSAEFAAAWNFGPAEADARPVRWIVDRVRERWPLDVRIEPPRDDVEAQALRLDASAARDQLGWKPAHDLASGLDATLDWHDEVRAGADARAVTLRQVAAQPEDAEQERREEDLDADTIRVAASTARRSSAARRSPVDPHDDVNAATRIRRARSRRRGSARARAEPRPHPVEPRVALAHEVAPVGVGASPSESTWVPTIISSAPAIIACRSHLRPNTST